MVERRRGESWGRQGETRASKFKVSLSQIAAITRMSRDYYTHSARSVASTSATPYDSPAGSEWATTRPSSRHTSSSQQLVPAGKPQLSLLKQEILSVSDRSELIPARPKLTDIGLQEEEYVQHLSDIIKRDFFPALRTLEGQHDILQAYESEDPTRIEESVRRMREICTPTPKRRHRGGFGPALRVRACADRSTSLQLPLQVVHPTPIPPPPLRPTLTQPPTLASLPLLALPPPLYPLGSTRPSPLTPSNHDTLPKTTPPSPSSSHETTPTVERSTAGLGTPRRGQS